MARKGLILSFNFSKIVNFKYQSLYLRKNFFWHVKIWGKIPPRLFRDAFLPAIKIFVLYIGGPAQQLRIRLHTIEQEIVAKRYLFPSDVKQAVADIDQLMTSFASSGHVTATPTTSGSGARVVVSASDTDLVRGAGSLSPDHTGSVKMRPRWVLCWHTVVVAVFSSFAQNP